MAFFSIRSENPKLSFVLRKNPASGLVVRELRKGHLFGYYGSSDEPSSAASLPDEQQFNVLFKDADTEVSFGYTASGESAAFEYVDTSRYDSPMIVIAAIGKLFHELTNGKETPEDEAYAHTITLGYVCVDRPRMAEHFQRHFNWALIALEPLDKHGYRVTLQARSTLARLLQLTQLFCLFVALTNRSSFIDKADSLIARYVRIIQELDAPYYIRHLFSLYFLRPEGLFHRFKAELERSARYEIELVRGDNHEARIAAVRERLTPYFATHHLLDVGCGEGRYVHLAKKLGEDLIYTGVDPDEKARERFMRRARQKDVDNAVVVESLDAFAPAGPTAALLTEVAEHMPQEDARQLITRLLQTDEIDVIVATTPNADFNRHYGFEDENERRHEDHHWEMGAAELGDWVRALTPEGWTATFFGAGDAVDGEHTTSGFVLTRDGTTPSRVTEEAAAIA